jgi:hypothetical protein
MTTIWLGALLLVELFFCPFAQLLIGLRISPKFLDLV